MKYTPDRWVLLNITPTDGEPWQAVLAGWNGSYLGTTMWKRSSLVMTIEKTEHSFIITTKTGSVYVCRKHSEGMTAWTSDIFRTMQKAKNASVAIHSMEEK